MSTNAYITLHNIPNSEMSEINTATFYRHCDGYQGEPMANMFYCFFDNKLEAKGSIEKMICSDPSQLQIDSFNSISKLVCNAEYHYHLDLENYNLIVLFDDNNGESKTVFNGLVSDFINEFKGVNCSVITGCFHQSNKLSLITKDSLFTNIKAWLRVLELTIKNPTNPNNKTYTKRIDRAICLLMEMNINNVERNVLDTVLEINNIYQAMI